MLITYLSSVLQHLKHKSSVTVICFNPHLLHHCLDEAKSGLGPNLMSLLTQHIWKISNTKTQQQPLCKR
jgi:hypothetical protein